MKYTGKKLDAYSKALSQLDACNVKLNQRVGEIVEIIYDSFGNKLRTWWFDNVELDGVGSIDPCIIQALMKNNDTDIFMEYESEGTIYKAIRTRRYDFSYSFPAKWLLWTDKQIKKFISDEIEKDKKEVKKEVEKDKALVKENDKLIEQALKKLTKKEIKALGLGI